MLKYLVNGKPWIVFRYYDEIVSLKEAVVKHVIFDL